MQKNSAAKNVAALKVTLSTSDILQNALGSEASKPQPYHYLWTFLQHEFNCKTKRDVDFFKPEKTRDFLSCLAYLTQEVPPKEVAEIKREANSLRNEVFIKEIFEYHGTNFYQLPTYVLRSLQRKLFNYMKPSYWGKYVYEELTPITLDEDMLASDENAPPNVKDLSTKDLSTKDLSTKDLSKDLFKSPLKNLLTKENTSRKYSFDDDVQESFF